MEKREQESFFIGLVSIRYDENLLNNKTRNNIQQTDPFSSVRVTYFPLDLTSVLQGVNNNYHSIFFRINNHSIHYFAIYEMMVTC